MQQQERYESFLIEANEDFINVMVLDHQSKNINRLHYNSNNIGAYGNHHISKGLINENNELEFKTPFTFGQKVTKEEFTFALESALKLDKWDLHIDRIKQVCIV
jgi:hypothetical protein